MPNTTILKKKHPLVSINLLTYNGEKYIDACLKSALNQTYPNFKIFVADNNSNDGTVEYLKDLNNEKISKIIFNDKQTGFAAGHNQLIKESDGDFVLCLNQDVVLDKNYISQAVEVFNQDDRIASVQGKICRFNPDGSFSNRIDTTGLIMLKDRRIINRGQGQIDRGQFGNRKEIFGADGAVPVFRRRALEDIALPVIPTKAEIQFRCHSEPEGRRISDECQNIISHSREIPRFARNDIALDSRFRGNDEIEYLDEDFFAYKEDVDLAWRLRLAGWKNIYQPTVLAWHWRGSGDSATRTPWGIINERRKLSKFSKFYAFKNQRLMQIKNDQIGLLLKHLPWVLWKELGAWGYVFIFEGYTLSAVKELIRQAPIAWRKRKIIMANKRATTKDIKKWFE